jgi:hypothetical protein
MTAEKIEPPNDDPDDVRRNRRDLLNLAVATARGEEPRSLERIRRFEAALIDVRVNAVMDRTLSALKEASDYLLDRGIA